MRQLPEPVPYAAAYAEDPGERLDLRHMWRTVLQNRWMILGFTAAVVLLVGALTWLSRPVYRAEATLQIDAKEQPSSGLISQLSPILLTGVNEGVLETDLFLLGSRQVAEGVVDSLALNVQLLAPEDSSRPGILRILKAPRDAREGIFELVREEDDSYTVHAQDAGSPPPSRHVVIGRPVQLGDVVIALNPALQSEPPQAVRIAVIPLRDAAAVVQSNLKITSTAPQIATVGYESHDPFLAAAVPNAVIASFLRYRSATKQSQTSNAVQFLRDQVASYGGQLRDAESELQRYREVAKVVSPTEEASESVRRLAELQAQRDQLLADRDALANLMQNVTADGASNSNGRSPYRRLASYPPFLENRAVQDILETLIQQENRRAELLVLRTPQSVDIRGIEQRIQELELQLYHTSQSYLASLDNQLKSLDASLARFGNQMEAIPARQVEFARLTRQQDLLDRLYTLLQTRLKDKEIQEAAELGDVRVIDPALVPENPAFPKPLLNMVAAVALGLMGGTVIAFVRQSLDTKVRTPEDVIAAAFGLPVLGTIPHIRSLGDGKRNGGGPPWSRRLPPSAVAQDGLVAHGDPGSPASEAYRTLRTNLTFAGPEQAPQMLLFTSAMPGDGKSLSASNLAITLAQQSIRTLLVDADLRRGSLHRRFSAERDPGLSQVLLGESGLNEAVQELDVAGGDVPLYFLATGGLPPNPAEMLGSERSRRLFAELRGRYDAVVIDAPPLNLFADAALLGREADATILITRSGVTEKKAVQQAAAQIHRMGTSGALVLNDVEDQNLYADYDRAYRNQENSTAPTPILRRNGAR